ncbi:MAG: hypothetical protein J6B89_01595 [Bacilli bacterium]|nr:hypothetical protein [Bacilli bacterium]
MASYWQQWWLMDGIRIVFATIDSIIYSLISVLYQIFFNVSNATLISGETIKAFYSRIQLILGILVMFKLAISLISGIMNPDTISDNKKGFFGIIKRIVLSLIMLVLIVPLNIPTADLGESGSYNSQLNNNGILFGTLYEFQNIVLSQNTIARLVLGVSNNVESSDINSTAKEAGNELATIILKCFVTINVKSDEGDPLNQEDRMCQDTDSQEVMITYLDPTVSPAGILNHINEYCDVGDNGGIPEIDEGEDYYVFNYRLLLSSVVGVLFVIVLLGFIIDVAIRAFKLAILRLISPIPIISYIDPKSEQNGAFGAWVKSVTTTYIDLFTRLAIVYFILFIIQEFSTNGIVMDVGTGAVGLFSKVFIILGLFFFAKEAPGFIQSSLGIQNKGPGLFSGIGKMMGVASGIAGAYRGGINAFRASRTASENSDLTNSGSFFNKWVKPMGAGVFGGASSGLSALETARDAKDHQYRRAMNKVNEMNAKRTQYAANGSTWWGSHKDGVRQAFTGMNKYDQLQRDESIYKRKAEEAKQKGSLFDSIMKEAKDKASTHRDTKGTLTYKDATGSIKKLTDVNYNDFMAARQDAMNRGLTQMTINNKQIDMVSAMDQQTVNDLLDSNTSDYLSQVYNGTITSKNQSFVESVNAAAKSSYHDEATHAKVQFDINNFLGSAKQFKGHYATDEYNANTKLDEIRANMPQAKANAERSKHDVR